MSSKEDFWRSWFGFHAAREAGNPHRTVLKDPDSLISYVKQRRTRFEPCFLSVQPYRARNQVYGLEKLFFDFDSKETPPNLEKTWNETSHFVNTLQKFYDIASLTVFSGNRGFHVYIWFWQVVEFKPPQEALAKAVYKLIQEKLLKGLTYKTLDPEVLGDIKRLARLPYTIHQKSGLKCEPSSARGQPMRILPTAIEGYRKNGIPEQFFRKTVEEAKLQQKLKRVKQSRRRHLLKISNIRPCITEALQTELNDEYGHLMRLAIAVECLNNGYTVDQIVPLFKTQSDFNPEKTRAMVLHAEKKAYKPRKQETIRRYGFCHGEHCSTCVKAQSKRKGENP